MDPTEDEVPAPSPDHEVAEGETELPSHHDGPKVTYKSFKKKYRKMRIQFDGTMQESNNLCTKEQGGAETAKRLAQEIDQLLDILLDVNESAQIPADKRIDLAADAPSLSAIPPLISGDELSEASQVSTPNGKTIYTEIRALMEENAFDKPDSGPSKSLALLMSVTPHLSTLGQSTLPTLPPAVRESTETLEGYPAPISYLTPEQVDEYVTELDAGLGSIAPAAAAAAAAGNGGQHEVALRNPHSVYNWLRRNEPKIFLQDGEGSEKSAGKPGSLRGAGKRASMPGPSKPDSLEIVEEDGMRYDPTIGGLEPPSHGHGHAKGKRKREDDAGYHPKSGTPGEGRAKKARPRKRKTDGEAGAAPGPRKGKKSRASTDALEAASNAS